MYRKCGEIVTTVKIFSRTHTEKKDKMFVDDRAKTVWVCMLFTILCCCLVKYLNHGVFQIYSLAYEARFWELDVSDLCEGFGTSI